SEGTRAYFRAKGLKSGVVYNVCETDGSKVKTTISGNMLSVTGDLSCQILLESEAGGVLYSPDFKIINHSPIVSDSEIEGTDEFSALHEALEEVRAIKTSLEKRRGLILNGTTTSETADIVLKSDNNGNPLKLTDDFTIYVDAPSSSKVGSVYIYFNGDIGAYIPNGVQKSGGKSRTTMHFNGRTWENYSVVSTSFTSNGTVNSIVRYEVDDEIEEIRINFASGFPAGTKYYLYGRVL
ncbi:MAG: hypothetical protein IIX89_04960, partial [Oscillospiraceae bacterium]|nr:hypothetical protein [Oscillospiraceae bacterium]